MITRRARCGAESPRSLSGKSRVAGVRARVEELAAAQVVDLVPGHRRAVDRARAAVAAAGHDRRPDGGADEDRGHLGGDHVRPSRRRPGRPPRRPGPARSREHEQVGLVGGQQARSREQQRMSRIDRARSRRRSGRRAGCRGRRSRAAAARVGVGRRAGTGVRRAGGPWVGRSFVRGRGGEVH